jgi:hypothetical protein
MGFEYHFHVSPWVPDQVEAVLRSLPWFERFDPKYKTFNFVMREGYVFPEMPDAQASIKATLLYFCDFGRSPSEVMKELVTRLESKVGKVWVEEL